MTKRRWLFLMLLLAACSNQDIITDAPSDTLAADGSPMQVELSEPRRANLQDLGPAPELENEVWLNVDHPLRLADLRGKVVLLDMWTFG